MFGNPVSDYFKYLGDEFVKKYYTVIYIFDGKVDSLPNNEAKIKYYSWPNKRPVKLKDFIFLAKLIKKEKPIITISNFGSTNVMSIISFFYGVKNRLNYIHTPSKANQIDFKGNAFTLKLLKLRKKLIYKLNTHLLTNSEGNKKDAITVFGINKNNITVLPLLIASSKIKYNKLQDREFSILIVGRLDPVKGHKSLLYLFKECVKLKSKLKLYIVGDGDLKNEIEKLIKKLAIDSNVVFLGRIPNKEIGRFYSKCVASISSSLEEAYGLVIIESLREGTPIICTKTAGSLDILEDKVNGRFIDIQKGDSLLIAFEDIMANWTEYSMNALNSFEKKFSLNNINIHYNILISRLDK